MNTTELAITIAVLVAEVALIIFCRWKLKQPVNIAKPRIVPYGAVMLFLGVAVFATSAHIISVVTGTQLTPKTSKMNR